MSIKPRVLAFEGAAALPSGPATAASAMESARRDEALSSSAQTGFVLDALEQAVHDR